METFYSQSTLEMLPDEILLEVCKYLLCSDILQSFMGLNRRMTHMITQYRHHVSFYKASILTSDYLCINILPQIGSHVRSLVIDRNYSSLQDELFIEHFGKKMSMIFPKLERISLTYYEHDRFLTFLDALHDLIHLTEIRLYDFFNTPISHQPTTVRSLCQANNHRFTTILVDDRSSCLNEQQQFPVPRLPKLPRLVQIFLYQSIPSDLHLFSFILNAAPNLFRLDLPFDCLWKLLEDQQTHNLFGQRITSLNIYKNATETSMTTVNEEHIPIIASVFPRVRDFYVDVTHLASSTTMNSNENTLEHTAVENSSVESIQQKHEVVSTLSSESMLLFLFKQFKQHKLTGLYIDGHFLEEIKTNTEQWLRNNSVLCEQQFKAVYSSEWSRILIWM
ncbi:unnamed protein product [Rotaria sp. Silwood2]|nr:unnamed protein product [Rotaria sp. Silwood2]CAF4593042.1 unnamed protein product [Rotaria sp. Silwood2]